MPVSKLADQCSLENKSPEFHWALKLFLLPICGHKPLHKTAWPADRWGIAQTRLIVKYAFGHLSDELTVLPRKTHFSHWSIPSFGKLASSV